MELVFSIAVTYGELDKDAERMVYETENANKYLEFFFENSKIFHMVGFHEYANIVYKKCSYVFFSVFFSSIFGHK